MKASFSSPGMMATHFAFSSRSRGMPLSGVVMISWKTRVAFSMRPMSSSRSDAKTGRSKLRPATETINTFLYTIFLLKRSTFSGRLNALMIQSLHQPMARLSAATQGELLAFRGVYRNLRWVRRPQDVPGLGHLVCGAMGQKQEFVGLEGGLVF